MTRGRKPTPTELKLVKGTQPCRINKDEPKPEPGLGNTPTRLDADGKRVWRELARECWWATRADRFAAEYLAEAMGEARRLRRWRRQEPHLFHDDGTVVKRDWRVSRIRELEERAIRLLADFGLNPSARSRIKAPARPKPADPAAEFF